MSETKFLYGAAVQGIQGFIFQTNKLREIVGASELVEEICTSKFAQLLGKKGYYPELKKKLEEDENCILHAAGNIKYVFDKKEDCEKIVREFPKTISEFAPGITVSQAVVKMEEGSDNFPNAVNELEKRLRIQRNKPMRSATLGLMGIERSHQTGLPVIYEEGKEHFDAGTFAKLQYEWENDGEKKIAKRHTTRNLCNKAFLPYDSTASVSESKIAYDIEKITGQNDWIAIIHADGNGLGQIVQKVGKDAKEFKKFSNELDKATTEAAYEAYQYLIKKELIQENEKQCIPIRPVVLGGDDFTVICRADIALDFATEFIRQFENKTQQYLSETIKNHSVFTEGVVRDKLTACAGIAYIKSSFPFYYGYELAEALCSRAKKDAKNKDSIREGKELPMSCLMFHKVQDSFTEDWDSIAKRELTPQPNISFEFGPYYLNDKDNRWTIGELKQKAGQLEGKEGNAVKSHLRNWMSLLHNNPEMANQKLERLKSMTTEEYRGFIEKITFKYDRNSKELQKTPVYDMLAIHTINTQKTKKEDE